MYSPAFDDTGAPMELIRYLTEHFFTTDELLARACIDARELEQLQRRRMVPLPSYRLHLDIACDSFFGAHRENAASDYYPKGAAAWIGALHGAAGEEAAHALFARRYRERLAQLAHSGITPRRAGVGDDAHIAAEWRHFLDGTYGVCTVSGLPEEIAAKEAAIVVIREVTGSSEQALTVDERKRLRAAVDLLDRVSAPFAPHEVAKSSRRRYVDDVRTAYRL